MPDPVLTPEDLRSATWMRLEKWLKERLETHRQKNDGDLADKDTQKVRGRIAEVKAVLDLARTLPAVDKEPPEPI